MEKYCFLRENAWNSPWSKRILAELGFMLEVSEAEGYSLDTQIIPVLETIYRSYLEDGVITNRSAQEAEQALLPLQSYVKAYEVTCAAHAHIDMNWMWGFQETASLTVDTLKTILKLMDEYPTFTFSQSQASVYKIIEQYYPQMLEQIRQRVHEGRWEVTASTWVEHDKNMAGSEAMARHLLYTKRYLSRLLDIPVDSVQLDFEPDTFGHTAQVPEVLSRSGVKYYYHCRGMEGPFIYNWRGPSGAELLVYREPAWYNQTIEYDLLLNVPSFCHTYHTKQYLKVYGVGDHGGGPTRRDLDRLIEMAEWPLFPTIRFGRMGDFFQKLELDRDRFPTVEGELNYVFTGCYTSQARVKQANRVGEERLAAAETLDSIAGNLCSNYCTASSFEPGWQKVLFNQFHDILPGSCVRESREYALGEFQDALAIANINANHAMSAVCENIDTGFLMEDDRASTSEGSGVGYGVEERSGYLFPAVERGRGDTRVYAVFNTTQYPRNTVAEFTVWDWPTEPSKMYGENAAGEQIPIQVLSDGTFYWGHRGTKVAVPVTVPALGYTSVVIHSKATDHVSWPLFPEPRVDRITDEPIVLENSFLRALFSPNTMELVSLVSKQTGQEFLDEPSGFFGLAMEDPSNQMTAWRVGRFAKLTNLNRDCSVNVTSVVRGSANQAIDFTIRFAHSSLRASVILNETDTLLRYKVTVDWNEVGDGVTGIPQLNFRLQLNRRMEKSRCTVPFGTIDRNTIKQDVPCLGLISDAAPGEAAALLADCKYGFRNEGQTLAVTLMRASFDPDPKPDIGTHSFDLGIYIGDNSPEKLTEQSVCFANPFCSCAVPIHKGALPLENSIADITGCVLTGFKQAESGEGSVLRVYNLEENISYGRIRFNREVLCAEEVAIPEWELRKPLTVDGNTVLLEIPKRGIATVRVVLK